MLVTLRAKEVAGDSTPAGQGHGFRSNRPLQLALSVRAARMEGAAGRQAEERWCEAGDSAEHTLLLKAGQ